MWADGQCPPLGLGVRVSGWSSGWATTFLCDLTQVTVLLSSQKGSCFLDILQCVQTKYINNNNKNLCFELSEASDPDKRNFMGEMPPVSVFTRKG